MSGYLPPSTPAEQIFCRRVADAAGRCEATGRPQYLGFLDERQQVLAAAQLSKIKWPEHLFFGGYPLAERKVLAVYADEPPNGEAFPLCCLRVSCRGGGLTHRDHLGALLALGLKRECVGDILPDSGGAYLFALSSSAALIAAELREVGREAVKTAICAPPADLAPQQGETVRASVASPRLDAVLSALLHVSRDDASALVRSERVLVNHVPKTGPAAQLSEGDILTVRGVGRFKLEEIGGQTREGRVFVTCIKY